MTETLVPEEKYPGFPNLNHLEPADFPKHTLIVMDGNRHYGKEHFGNSLAGHPEGAKNAIRIMKAALPLPGEVLTFWGFSSDNWKRETTEVDQLMSIIGQTITQNSDELLTKGIRFVHLGRKDRIPEGLARTMSELENATQANGGKILCAAIDFGGSDQEQRIINHAVRIAIEESRKDPHKSEGEIVEIFNSEWITQARDGNGLIRPADLIIRPQHYRTSDIGWLNGSATELYLRPDLQFPDMTPADLEQGVLQYTRSKKNYGA